MANLGYASTVAGTCSRCFVGAGIPNLSDCVVVGFVSACCSIGVIASWKFFIEIICIAAGDAGPASWRIYSVIVPEQDKIGCRRVNSNIPGSCLCECFCVVYYFEGT